MRARTFSSTNGAGTTGYHMQKNGTPSSHCIQKLTQNGLTVKMQNGVAAVEIRIVVPQKQTNIELPSDPLLGISKRIESKNSNRCWYASVHSGIIHNGQKMETGLFCLLHNVNAETLRFAAKRGFICKTARWGNRRTSLESASLKAKGSGYLWHENQAAGWSGGGEPGKVTGEKCGSLHSVQAQLSYKPLQVHRIIWGRNYRLSEIKRFQSTNPAHAQVEGQWSYPVLTGSAQTRHSWLHF